MTKLFLILIVAFFIAEIIIAVVAIVNICKLNYAVNKLNDLISVNQPSIKFFFMDLRAIFEDFIVSIGNFKQLIKEKKTLYLYNVLKTIIVYIGIFSLKGKYKKTAIAFQVAKEVYEGILEA